MPSSCFYFHFIFISPPVYVHYRKSNNVHTKKEKNKSPSINYLGLIAINILGIYSLNLFSLFIDALKNSYLIVIVVFVREKLWLRQLPEAPGVGIRILGPEFGPHLSASEALSHSVVFDLPAA